MLFDIQAEPTGLQVYRNNQQFVTTDAEGKILLWSFQGDNKKLMDLKKKISCCTISDDNQYLYIAIEGDFQILKINLLDMKIELEFQKSHLDVIFSMRTIFTGQRLISGGADKRIILWSAQTGQSLGEFYDGHLGAIQDLCIAKGLQELISAGRDCQIIKWSIDSFQKKKVFDRQHNEWVSSLALDNQEKFLYSGGGDKLLCKWEVQDGKLLGKFESQFQDKILSIVISSCGRFIFSGDFLGSIFIWNTEEFRLVKMLEKHKGKIRGLKLAQNDGLLVSASIDKTIKLWTLEFTSSLSKIIGYFQTKEVNMGIDMIKTHMQIGKNFNDILELFFISNSFGHPIDKIVAQKIDQQIKELLSGVGALKPENIEKVVKSFQIFYWKFVSMVSKKNQTSQIMLKYQTDDAQLENILQTYKQQQDEIFKQQNILKNVQQDCQHLQEVLLSQNYEDNKDLIIDQI